MSTHTVTQPPEPARDAVTSAVAEMIPADAPQTGSLESRLTDEVLRMYQEVADHPDRTFHFHHGRNAARRFGYDPVDLRRVPAGAVASFAGVGNPHLRAALQPGESVLDLGSGAGLDAVIAALAVGPTGAVAGVDMNPTMCQKAQVHAAAAGVHVSFHRSSIERLPLPASSVDAVISNGVINLAFCKRRVFAEVFRVLKPGGRLSFTDIVSAKQLSQAVVNDPKLWAS